MSVRSPKELIVYQKGFELGMRVFEITKRMPRVEAFALVSQLRRSSRSICMNLREAWAKRRYSAHFISKLTDCDGEAGETDTSLDYAFSCRCITAEEHAALVGLCCEVGKMLGAMIKDPEPFLLRTDP